MAAPAALVVFDACHAGVVLRAVLFVETVLGAAVAFTSPSLSVWLGQLALLTGAVLPATLAWLLIACSLKRWLQRLGLHGQWAAGVLLGALAGAYACAMLYWLGLGQQPAPWLASAISGALLAAALVAALVLRAQARTPAATTARLTELQARIRPHFLFNTLNSAIALVRDEPAKAEALLEDLSDLFRSALSEPSEAVTLNEEITLAQRYLAIEQVRFGPRLQVQWRLDPEAGSALLPPLLLQPLVENAVKHGVEPSAHGSQLYVSTKRRGRWVHIRISNTLPTCNPASHPTQGHGMALANVRARLLLLHDVQCSFSAGIHGPTYQVRITVPAIP